MFSIQASHPPPHTSTTTRIMWHFIRTFPDGGMGHGRAATVPGLLLDPGKYTKAAAFPQRAVSQRGSAGAAVVGSFQLCTEMLRVSNSQHCWRRNHLFCVSVSTCARVFQFLNVFTTVAACKRVVEAILCSLFTIWRILAMSHI